MRWAVVVAAALVAAGCASGGAPSGPIDWDDELDLGVPGALIETVARVTYYPACGNEVLTYEGEDWYPFTPENIAAFPVAPRALASAPLGFARASAAVKAVPAVALPGPGEDEGTLTRYEGGFAHWTSSGAELETWLTTTVLEYRWVC